MKKLLGFYRFSTQKTNRDIQQLLNNNRAWSDQVLKMNPDFFPGLAQQQTPKFLWIGCVDSRVSPERLTGMLPGQLFVQRNVGNQVIHTDLNCLSVVQYAVEVLKVRHIIVCGHYNCSSVKIAITNQQVGLINNWILHIRDYYLKHQKYIDQFEGNIKWDKLVEINIVEQVLNLGLSTIVQNAWQKGQLVYIHGWVYGVQDGLVRDLNISSCSLQQLKANYDKYLDQIKQQAKECKEDQIIKQNEQN
ncbi:carbonic anhydrase (macronuclear) [Tetrahymena thermophila SB210]|uniref:Carbonic anhydrase n=1 Tax=Tetrahymena thermophila (strain SB210) TaxID=312017 RepID=Q23AV1_TETTS|nr:carbonic anhydrase [Tetrahymena thermophila SB210]EAR93733.2 carbonic anhydrase [Tetrahymena thermophila SB210]|eukprot:XP_001013978.2 carbonic anhydrase [Tetrahymena thermophila SB210]